MYKIILWLIIVVLSVNVYAQTEVQLVPIQHGVSKPSISKNSQKIIKKFKKINDPSPNLKQKNKQSRKIELNFEQAPLSEVLRTIMGEYLKKSYIIEPGLNPGLSLYVQGEYTNGALLTLLCQALRLYGIELIEKNNVFLVVRKEKASQLGLPITKQAIPKKEGIVILIYRLSYIEPKIALNTIKPFLSQKAPIIVNPAISGLILADEKENIKTILQILQTIDSFLLGNIYIETIPLKHIDANIIAENIKTIFNDLSILKNNPKIKESIVIIPLEKTNYLLVAALTQELLNEVKRWIKILDSIEVTQEERIYVRFIKNAQAKDIADILNQLYETGVTPESKKKKIVEAKVPLMKGEISGVLTGRVKIIADEVNNALVILANPQDYQTIEKAIKQLDILPRQVLIDVVVAEVTLKGEITYGVEWYLKNRGIETGRISAIQDFGYTFNPEAALGEAAQKGLSIYYATLSQSITSLLTALSTKTKVRILSSPTVLATDQQEAEITVGGKVPTLTQTLTTVEAAGQIVQSVQYQTYGIILKVTPRISSGGLVRLDVTQEYTDVSRETYAGLTTPAFIERSVKTKLVAKDGQTVVIGGLIQTKVNKVKKGIPLLKDIPLIGFLFGSWEKTEERTELIVAITPHVVPEKPKMTIGQEFLNKIKHLKDVLEKGSY